MLAGHKPKTLGNPTLYTRDAALPYIGDEAEDCEYVLVYHDAGNVHIGLNGDMFRLEVDRNVHESKNLGDLEPILLEWSVLEGLV
jgi:hypothetical protein